MTYAQAKRKALIRTIAGLAIALLALISTIISLLKMVYFRLDDGTALGTQIARPFKALVELAYEHTQFLSFFWAHSPTPNIEYLPGRQNYYFLAIYFLVFVGGYLHASGKRLSSRLAKIDQKIEDKIMEESLTGPTTKTRQDMKRSAEIPNERAGSEFKTLILYPILTAVVAGLILKLLGAV